MDKRKRLKLFDNIPPEFFRVLAYGSIEDSFELIIAIDDFFGSGAFDVDREKIVTYLADYISTRSKEEKKEFDPEEEEGITASEKARSFLRRLVRSGWLDKESGADFSERLSRSDAFMKIVPVLREIALEETKTNEFFGLSDDIHRSLLAFDFASSTAALEQLEARSEALTRYLLSVNSQMRRFIHRALANTDVSERQIIETLLDRFQRHPALIALNNLQGKNNPELHHPDIDRALENLREVENHRALVLNYLETKHLDPNDESNVQKASDFVDHVLDEVERQFDQMPSFIQGISARNAMYVQTTKNILEFRLNNFKDIQSAINACLKLINNCPDDLEIDSPFYLVSSSTIDAQSIYKPRLLQKKAPKSLEFIEPEIDEKALAKAEAFVQEENRYSKKGLSAFLLLKMRKEEMLASEFKGEPLETFIRLLLIPAYKLDGYKIGEPSGENFKIGPYRLNDYLIERKEEETNAENTDN